jgi:UDP-N-acetylglucosamine--N-acetylmuramyl-(pentapeptide) pyrophosphoryl-undecaprenol N-acetylglucosamine transferase
MNRYRYIFSGGGTSGHVNPALAVADQIMSEEPDAEIRFLGTQNGIERELVTRAGFSFSPVQAAPFPRRPSMKLIHAFQSFRKGKKQALAIMNQWHPHVVIGTGGYVCSPVVAAASSLKIPILLHEQNAFPGRSNRLMAKKSQVICVAFSGTDRYFPSSKPVVVTGNPVRSVFFNQDRQKIRSELHPESHRPLILAMGGSLGARTINEAILGLAEWISQRRANGLIWPRILLSAGERQYETVAPLAVGQEYWLEIHPYIHDIHRYMSAADILICRAGALTCSEIAAVGRPSILVPYPYAAGNHQVYNARILETAGAAVQCPDDRFSPEWLALKLARWIDEPERLDQMGRAALSLARPNAALDIYRQISGLHK